METRAALGAAPLSGIGRRRRAFRLAPLVGWGSGAILLLPLVFILLALDLPLAITLAWSLSDPQDGASTLANYADFFGSSTYLRIIGRTFAIAAAVTTMTALIGYPLAYWITRLAAGTQSVMIALVVITFWVPILVRTYAWIVLFGNAGLVNRTLQATGLTTMPVAFLYNETGVAFGMLNVLLPYLVLPLYAAMRRVDPRLLQAAATLGATPGQVFRRVFFPLTLPALAASMVLVFILSLGFFVTPAILGGGRVPMIANMMDLLINRFSRWEMAAVNAVVLLLLTLLLYGIYQWLREKR